MEGSKVASPIFAPKNVDTGREGGGAPLTRSVNYNYIYYCRYRLIKWKRNGMI